MRGKNCLVCVSVPIWLTGFGKPVDEKAVGGEDIVLVKGSTLFKFFARQQFTRAVFFEQANEEV